MSDALQQVLLLTRGEMPQLETTEKGWHVSWRRDYPGDAEFWRRLDARIAVLVSGEDAGEQEGAGG